MFRIGNYRWWLAQIVLDGNNSSWPACVILMIYMVGRLLFLAGGSWLFLETSLKVIPFMVMILGLKGLLILSIRWGTVVSYRVIFSFFLHFRLIFMVIYDICSWLIIFRTDTWCVWGWSIAFRSNRVDLSEVVDTLVVEERRFGMILV